MRWNLRVCVIKGNITFFSRLHSVLQGDMRCTEQVDSRPCKKLNSLICHACVRIMLFNFIEAKRQISDVITETL